MKRNKIRNDIILAAVLMIAAVIGFIIFSHTLKNGSRVVVISGGKQTAEYPLSDDTETEIASEGSGSNVLIIEGGKAYIKSANCPDGICAEHRAISKAGETIVCLPHRLVIEIR